MIALYEKASLILAWSLPEAVHYIKTLKKQENSAPSILRKSGKTSHFDSVYHNFNKYYVRLLIF